MSLPVYSRADLSRIPELVVAPALPVATTRTVACEFRAADTGNEDDPIVRAQRYMGLIVEPGCGRHQTPVFHPRRRAGRRKTPAVTIVADFDREPFEAAMTAIDAMAQRHPATAELTGLSRKVE
jgi:hypothetical protein